MRLIDADELAKELMHEGLGYQYNRVINAPTVDAIPVIWLKKLSVTAQSDEACEMINEIIARWEARKK